MITLADVFRRFADDYCRAHGASMLPSHRRAIADILACRTPARPCAAWLCHDAASRSAPRSSSILAGRALASIRNLTLSLIRARGLPVREAHQNFREDRAEAISIVTGRIL